MLSKRPILLSLAIMLVLPSLADAAAVLFIHPTLIMFEGNERSATITLTNRGDETGTFEMSWADMVMTPQGGLVRHEGATPPWSVQSFVRYSPRRVTLEPLASQVIRIAVRRGLNVPEGEYYAHFRVLTLNSESPAAEPDDEGEAAAAITIDARSAVAIPVIWRNSSQKASASIQAVRVDRNNNQLSVDVRRHGPLSVRGYLQVVETAADGTLTTLTEPVPLVIYPNLEARTISIPLPEGILAANLKPGTEVFYSPELKISDRSIAIDTHPIAP